MQATPPTLGILAARAHDLLSRGGHPLSAETLIEHVFGIARSTPRGGSKTGVSDFWGGQLARVLSNAEIFTQYSDGSWGLIEWGTVDVALELMEYVVVDCETTGLNPLTQRVIEIAALRCRGPRILDRFETLIDPQRRIPLAIRQLTGITNELLSGAPEASEALLGFLRFAGGALLVGHNVRFDLNFLGAEALRHHNVRLLNPSIDTIRLARQLLPQVRRFSLDNLAKALDLPTRDRHRAMGDALVTQQAFWRLVELSRERGIATQGRLQVLIGPASGSVRAVGRGTGRLLLDPALRRDLPEKPGVYLMKDEWGKVIYVGKAKNLKQRIASYYSHPLGYRRKMDGLLEAVRDLQTIVVGSELEALIRESQLIKAYDPHFNVQQRYYRHYPFIKVDVCSHFPRVSATREVLQDGARYFGPYRSKRAVDTVVDLVHRIFPVRSCTRIIAADGSHRGKGSPCMRSYIGRCLAPCHGAVTPAEYRAMIDEVLHFLGGGQEGMLARVGEEMLRASAREDFERAARLRDALRQARQIMVSQQLLSGAVEQNNLVIVCPSVEHGGAELFGIRHGRLFEQCSLRDVRDAGVAQLIEAFLDRLGAAAAASPIVGQEEIDAIIIIGRWLERYGDRNRVVHLPLILGPDVVTNVLDVARTIHLHPQPGIDEADDEELEEWEQQVAVSIG